MRGLSSAETCAGEFAIAPPDRCVICTPSGSSRGAIGTWAGALRRASTSGTLNSSTRKLPLNQLDWLRSSTPSRSSHTSY